VARSIGELPRAYWVVWIGTLINRLGAFFVSFIALYLTTSRGLTVREAGTVMSLFGLGSMGAGPLGGVLADRVGRRATMLIGLFGGSAAMLGLGFAQRPVVIAANALLLGLISDLYRPAVHAMVADLVPPERRLAAYGHLYWAVNLGFSLAPILGGLLVRRSYFLLFAADAATTFVYGLIVLSSVRETRTIVATVGPAGPPSGLAEVLRDRVFVTFVGLSFLNNCIFLQVGTTLPIDAAAHGTPASTYGFVISLNGILIVLLQPFSQTALRPYRRSRVLAAAALLTGTGFGMYAFASSAAWYAAGVVLFTLGEIAATPATSSIVADLAPSHMRGRYQGVFLLSWGLATFLAPSIGAELLARAGSAALWGGCFALGVLVALGHLAIANARRRRLELIRAA
jgi:MFS family permease